MTGSGKTATLAGVEAQVFELSLCTLHIAAPAPSILATRVEGMGTLEMVERVVAFGDGLLEEVSAIRVFHDFSAVSGYRPEARRELVDWGVRNEGRLLETHVLFRSKVVAMGVSMATAVLRGSLTGYSKRHEFEAARREAIREAFLAG